MKNFDIEDPITKLNQVSTKRGEVLIANKISKIYYIISRENISIGQISQKSKISRLGINTI
jgi:hypothetical protein